MGGVVEPTGPLQVLLYDRCHVGTRRLHTNADLLQRSANGIPIAVAELSRSAPFPGERDVETILLGDEARRYDALVITGLGAKSSAVVESAKIAAELNGFPLGRMVYLHVIGSEPSDIPSGMQTLGIRRGDAYFTSEDATALVGRLTEIGRAPR